MTFLSTTEVVDALYTELPAAALLLATAWCAVRFVRHETKWRAISFGIALGLLALTKAAFFSVGIAFILLLLLLDRRKLVRRNDAPSRQLRAAYAALGARVSRDVGAVGGSQRDQPRPPGDDRGPRRGDSRFADDLDRAAPTRIALRFKSPAIDGKARPLVGVFARGPRAWRKAECRSHAPAPMGDLRRENEGRGLRGHDRTMASARDALIHA